MSGRRIAFFGATGDCAGHCLAAALQAGYDCVALARTPAKLTQSMKAKGVGATALDQHLTIVEGNAKDVAAVKSTLQLGGRTVDTIVSGIGAMPTLQWSIVKPVILVDPTICQDAGNTVLKALAELALPAAQRPLLINVSTTGIWLEGMPRDIPIFYYPFYRWLLQAPHADKEILQTTLIEHVRLPESERCIRAFVNAKPTLLMDGDGKGLQAIREGVDERPAIGYTIQRKDVGVWVFERLVRDGPKEEWLNKSVSLTY